MADRHPVPFRGPKQCPSGFGEADFVLLEELIRSLEQDCHHLAAVRAEQHLRSRSETLGPAHRAVGSHHDDRLALGVQMHASHTEQGAARARDRPGPFWNCVCHCAGF
jgi:hypothetical protein